MYMSNDIKTSSTKYNQPFWQHSFNYVFYSHIRNIKILASQKLAFVYKFIEHKLRVILNDAISQYIYH